MSVSSGRKSVDSEVALVVEALREAARREGKSLTDLFGSIVRQALDEVIDGRRTGRYALEQLAAEEKKYVGTKVEIICRSELQLEKAAKADAVISGVETEIKWSSSSHWMIGPENIGKVCLGIGLLQSGSAFCAGVFRASREHLTVGGNRDGKVQLTAAARLGEVTWLVQSAALPKNFVAEIPSEIRARILGAPSAQERVALLFKLLPRQPIPRDAVETVARNKNDPMRRLRQDKYNPGALDGLKLLSAKYGNGDAARLGLPKIPRDHWIAVPLSEYRRGAPTGNDA